YEPGRPATCGGLSGQTRSAFSVDKSWCYNRVDSLLCEGQPRAWWMACGTVVGSVRNHTPRVSERGEPGWTSAGWIEQEAGRGDRDSNPRSRFKARLTA